MLDKQIKDKKNPRSDFIYLIAHIITIYKSIHFNGSVVETQCELFKLQIYCLLMICTVDKTPLRILEKIQRFGTE